MPCATGEALNTFFADIVAPGDAASVVQAALAEERPRSPIDPAVLQAFFAQDADGKWRCAAEETDEHECKQKFN